jgi:DNA-binding response OmpR family regulator
MAKILLIEDEKAMSDLIAIKFKVEGMEVDQAFTVADAKQKLANPTSYDAILSDYLLPDGNALDLLAEVKQLPQVANVPIVMATNYVEDLSADKAKALGITEVIVKYQVVPAQMVEKIKALLGVAAPAQPAAAEPPTENPVPEAPSITPDPAAVVPTPSQPVDPAPEPVVNPWATPSTPDPTKPS